MGKDDKIKICIFAGGRGSATIADALLDHPRIDLTILVNAYDDGLSTGQLRRFIPGMLGPSDIRKNYSRMLRSESPSQVALRTLLEYRFPTPMDHLPAVEILAGLAQLSARWATSSSPVASGKAAPILTLQSVPSPTLSALRAVSLTSLTERH
ncbi:MAG: YvcK family protein [Deltaproteobacteria bacterium]|nr:YvcK family protein [Deltaproteobacteria bacterium]